MAGPDLNRLRKDLEQSFEALNRAISEGGSAIYGSLRSLEGEWTKIQTRLDDARRTGGAVSPSTEDTWNQARLLRELAVVSRLEIAGLKELPKELQIPGLRPSLDRMMDLTVKDGRERGKIGFLDSLAGKLVLGQMHIGDAHSVKLTCARPDYQGRVSPILDIHTHPSPSYEPARVAEHLSPTDFKSSLSSHDFRLSLVVTKGKTLLIAKSLDTPRSVSAEEFKERLVRLEAAAERSVRMTPLGAQPGDHARVLTKLLCREYGFSLYMADASDRGLFKRVSLD